MIMTQADSPTAGFRSFFNPATGEWITYTATGEDNAGQPVAFGVHPYYDRWDSRIPDVGSGHPELSRNGPSQRNPRRGQR